MREDETIADQSDDYDVYERKRPRDETDDPPESPVPGRRLGRRPPTDDATADPPVQVPWLGDEAEPDDVDETFIDDDEGALTPAALAALPDPPARPLQAEAPLSRFTARAAAAPAATTVLTPSSPSRSTIRSNAPAAPGDAPMRLAIACTEFNYDITSMMLERARAHADVLGAELAHIVRVPGVYDLPLAVQRLLARDDTDAVVALGCVIEGETDHDDLVIQHAARKLVDLSLTHDKPVGLGITGPGMSRLQAMARIDRAKDAVEAVVRLHRDLAAL